MTATIEGAIDTREREVRSRQPQTEGRWPLTVLYSQETHAEIQRASEEFKIAKGYLASRATELGWQLLLAELSQKKKSPTD